MTRERMYGSDTDFCAWMRRCKDLPSYGDDFGFVASDNDLTIHRYKTSVDSVGTREVQGIMQIEIKTRNGKPPASQTDTLTKLNLFCGDRRVSGIDIRFFGVFVLVMSGTSPDDSSTMWWGATPKDKFLSDAKHMNWNQINKSQLIEILRMECHPRNLKDKTPFRRHHKKQSFIEKELTILGFEVERIVTKRS